MPNIKTTEAEWSQARQLFASGMRLVDISVKLGISKPSLSKKAKAESWRRTEPPDLTPTTDGTRKQVKLLCGFGLTNPEIAAVIGIDQATLESTYAAELVTAGPEMIARVAQSMLRMATDSQRPNFNAAKFWLECRAGWDAGGSDSTEIKGKKERVKHAAQTVATGKFAAPAGPRLAYSKDS